ncbi:hypothetical protein KFL_002310190 [Klebsormidium nitens]|uniref:Globin domain-containing protein n=1 Tax=Klebsormidium nitens TaxID=105231 RepID=A0A1Y1I4E0_KLENI|nr:hypothetical protein KFL_002310190 [Klebsormidium nitens]|eukprot:GAQ85363.1 hypothetical protein KFL_002310190 [Klebsormidium nitens]
MVSVDGHSPPHLQESASLDQDRLRRPEYYALPAKNMSMASPEPLMDLNGVPSMLEKALCFLETRGAVAEGILRKSADVEQVEYRLSTYYQGKDEFGERENPHVVADCMKHQLRRMAFSPVPEECCTALLQAYCKVLQKSPTSAFCIWILHTLHVVSCHVAANSMSTDAVARCMAPLLLRPLFLGEIFPGANESGSFSGSRHGSSGSFSGSRHGRSGSFSGSRHGEGSGSFSGSRHGENNIVSAMSAASSAVDLTVALINAHDTVFESVQLSPFEQQLVQKTWKLLQPRLADLGQAVFTHLFQKAPKTRPLYTCPLRLADGDRRTPDGHAIPTHAVEIVSTIGLAACRIGSSSRILAVLERLGQRHVAYGAAPDMFSVFKEAFLVALKKTLGGEHFTAQVHKAWSKALDSVVAHLKKGLKRGIASTRASS